MSRTYVPVALRQQVFDRAAGRCEYCRFPQQLSFATFEYEHIVAEKHGGATTADNLALSCPFCNRFKGTDLGSLDPDTGQLTPFFHPRNHQWVDHFRLEGARIISLTPEGRVTVFIFQLNHPDRIAEREPLIQLSMYP
jgi:hypothetical protein